MVIGTLAICNATPSDFFLLESNEASLEFRVDSTSKKTFPFMSTRMQNPSEDYYTFKQRGKECLAHRCDWFICDESIIKNVDKKSPETIFLSMKNEKNFEYFVDTLLPKMDKPFVLVIGGADATFPLGEKDERWPTMKRPKNQACYKKLMQNPYLKACFVENLDKKEDKLIPIPLGILHKDQPIYPLEKVDFSQRELKAMCIQRIHVGSSWDERKTVTKLCKGKWKDFVYYKSSCSREEFLNTLKTYPFCVCVHGGGLDPSPKAWEALAMGCIPIIERSTLDEAYSRLPVAYIDKWDEHALSKEKLEEWLKRLRPFYENPQKRAEVIRKLSLDYWWKEITSKLYS